MSLSVYLGGHGYSFAELLELTRHAESLGYDSVLVDGDASEHGDREVLDGWSVTLALLLATERIAVGSLRLVHHWHAAHLARAVATAERLAPGRLRFQIAIGDRPEDARYGLPQPPPRARIAWLDETLDAAEALWRGEEVSRLGRYVRLDRARLRTPPARRIPVEIAAKGPRMLELVAARADVWEVNLPPVARLLAAAEDRLARACARRGRDPAGIGRSMLLWVRLSPRPDAAPFVAGHRRLNPWFRFVPDHEIEASLVVGEAAHCRARIAELASALHLTQPAVDLTGLAAPAALRHLEALSPDRHLVDAVSASS